FFDPNQAKEGLEVLEHSKGFIRSSLAKKMDTRRIPEISFVLDDGFQREERITELLNNAKKNK
ncbi:MAG: ribosome-binding factor A, partial [Bacilli bacterium]|nr:ribosome-binding factor A [Bacilli bacterium]